MYFQQGGGTRLPAPNIVKTFVDSFTEGGRSEPQSDCCGHARVRGRGGQQRLLEPGPELRGESVRGLPRGRDQGAEEPQHGRHQGARLPLLHCPLRWKTLDNCTFLFAFDLNIGIENVVKYI